MLGKIYKAPEIPEEFKVQVPGVHEKKQWTPHEAALAAIKRHNKKKHSSALAADMRAVEKGQKSVVGRSKDWDPVAKQWRHGARIVIR